MSRLKKKTGKTGTFNAIGTYFFSDYQLKRVKRQDAFQGMVFCSCTKGFYVNRS